MGEDLKQACLRGLRFYYFSIHPSPNSFTPFHERIKNFFVKVGFST